jgi:hypothetical protein
MLSKKTSKKEVLDLYEGAIKRERGRLAKQSKKQLARAQASDGDSSDSDMSLNNVEPINRKNWSDVEKSNVQKRTDKLTKKLSSQIKSSLRKSRKEDKDKTLEEEEVYQNKVAWLKDHGESDHNEELNFSEDLN